MKIKLTNGNIVTLVRWLNGQPLKGQSSRLRTRFVKFLEPLLQETDKYRTNLLQESAKTDEKGEYVMVEDNYGRLSYDLTPEDLEKVRVKYEERQRQEVEVSFGDEYEKSYAFISNLVLNTGYEFKGQEAEEYDAWCTAFENAND